MYLSPTLCINLFSTISFSVLRLCSRHDSNIKCVSRRNEGYHIQYYLVSTNNTCIAMYLCTETDRAYYTFFQQYCPAINNIMGYYKIFCPLYLAQLPFTYFGFNTPRCFNWHHYSLRLLLGPQRDWDKVDATSNFKDVAYFHMPVAISHFSWCIGNVESSLIPQDKYGREWPGYERLDGARVWLLLGTIH